VYYEYAITKGNDICTKTAKSVQHQMPGRKEDVKSMEAAKKYYEKDATFKIQQFGFFCYII